MRCGRFQLPTGKRTLLMGILNVTPDSFSDGGKFFSPRRALDRALKMEEEGADLIDVGGESTRPGSQGVPAREEMRRILPVLEGLSKRLSIPVSVDTSKAAVAEAAIGAGASLVNDVTALSDPRMAEVVSRAEVPVILMHMRGTPRTMQKLNHYRRLVPEVVGELKASIARARAAGIPRERILIDPGLGFGKNAEQNFLLLKGLPSLKALDFPVVIGPSRKSFIGAPVAAAAQERVAAPPPAPAERLFGTAAVVALGVYLGADVVRVHDVGAMRQVVEVAEAFRLS